MFNIDKLDWFNGYYIRQMSLDKLTDLCVPYLIKAGLLEPKFKSKQYPPAYGAYFPEISYGEKLEKIIGLEQERMKKLIFLKNLNIKQHCLNGLEPKGLGSKRKRKRKLLIL